MIKITNKTIHYDIELDKSYTIEDITMDFLRTDFYGTLQWSDKELKEKSVFYKRQFVSYITFLIELINSLSNFLINKNSQTIKNYLAELMFDSSDRGYNVWLIDNTGKDGYIYMAYFWNGGINLVQSNQEEADLKIESDKPQSLINFIFNFNDTWSQFMKEKKDIDVQYYIKAQPREFLKDVLPAFEENIKDIPEGSIIWQAPLLKETMVNFEELKTYAKEKGWRSNDAS